TTGSMPVASSRSHGRSDVGLSSDPAKRAKQLANLNHHPPAPPVGNGRARQHGAYSQLKPARVDAKVREVTAALSQDAPVRDVDGGLPAADGVIVRQLAEALCRLDD